MRRSQLTKQPSDITLSSNQQTPILPLLPLPQIIHLPPIPNTYLEQLKNIYNLNASTQKPLKQRIINNLNTIINIFHKAQIKFLYEQSLRMNNQEYSDFLVEIRLECRNQGEIVIQRNKKNNCMYVLLQGDVEYWMKSNNTTHTSSMNNSGTNTPIQESNSAFINSMVPYVQDDEGKMIGVAQAGTLLYPELLMIPKYTNFQLKCRNICTLMSIPEDTYNKYLKRHLHKYCDSLFQILRNNVVFQAVSTSFLRKYLPFFIERNYKYNQIIYKIEDISEQVFFIVKGEVQFFGNQVQQQIHRDRRDHRDYFCNPKDLKQVGVVFFGEGQCFGLEEINNFRQMNARSRVADLNVLVLSSDILKLMAQENNQLSLNITKHLKKTEPLHNTILHKNMKIMDGERASTQKKLKKNQKKGKKQKISLNWWGLAEDIKNQHRYRIYKKPQTVESFFDKSSLAQHKINQLKRKVINGQQEGIEKQNIFLGKNIIEDDNKEKEHDISNNKIFYYAPKIKTKINYLQLKPTVLGTAHLVMNKLYSYAKNNFSFCQQLDLQ